MSLQFFNRGLRSGRLLQTYISAVGIWSSGLVGGTGVLRTISSADGVAGINRQESKRIFPKKRTDFSFYLKNKNIILFFK